MSRFLCVCVCVRRGCAPLKVLACVHQPDFKLACSERLGWDGLRGARVIKGRLIALWETEESTIMCS